jgi:hypothetical protein
MMQSKWSGKCKCGCGGSFRAGDSIDYENGKTFLPGHFQPETLTPEELTASIRLAESLGYTTEGNIATEGRRDHVEELDRKPGEVRPEAGTS